APARPEDEREEHSDGANDDENPADGDDVDRAVRVGVNSEGQNQSGRDQEEACADAHEIASLGIRAYNVRGPHLDTVPLGFSPLDTRSISAKTLDYPDGARGRRSRRCPCAGGDPDSLVAAGGLDAGAQDR